MYIRDERYQTPTLEIVTASDDAAAEQIVRERLASSIHYLGAEIWEEERLVAKLDKEPA
jgi:hypothetical protein